jgi:galactose mutarotase-like enzyme
MREARHGFGHKAHWRILEKVTSASNTRQYLFSQGQFGFSFHAEFFHQPAWWAEAGK